MKRTNAPQLVASTSGVRGIVGNGLDPILVTRYAAAFGTYLKRGRIVLGRDSRTTGPMVARAAIAGLTAVGIDVIDIGMVPTPTVEIAIKELGAQGGICVTASHNPAPWNALKFFNARGEFVTPDQYASLDAIFQSGDFAWKDHRRVGTVTEQPEFVELHIKRTLQQKAVAKRYITKQRYKVVIDAINGAGSYALPELCRRLGCRVWTMNTDGDGNFVHEPEPIPKNLKALGAEVQRRKADIGLACDPDADRLVLVDETGTVISEELTLTIAVMEILRQQRGPVVINLSTSRVTADVAKAHGSRVHYAKVGEANVVAMMNKVKAVIGGEGNGGVIYPQFHAGRDALIGAGLVLSALAMSGRSLSEIVAGFPVYHAVKTKAPLPADFERRLVQFEREADQRLGEFSLDRRDGLRFDFSDGWLQLRKSNTEPIYRLIIETNQRARTRDLLAATRAFFDA